jgi:hypothetical protein
VEALLLSCAAHGRRAAPHQRHPRMQVLLLPDQRRLLRKTEITEAIISVLQYARVAPCRPVRMCVDAADAAYHLAPCLLSSASADLEALEPHCFDAAHHQSDSGLHCLMLKRKRGQTARRCASARACCRNSVIAIRGVAARAHCSLPEFDEQ